jgi:hypothetical protein
MKYTFNYFKKRGEAERSVELDADNDRQAVLKFFDEFGMCEFGCMREDGHFFTDEKFPKAREMIKSGC